MQQLNFFVIKITFFLVMGILLSNIIDFLIYQSIGISVIILAILSIVFLQNKNRKKRSIVYGLISYFAFISLGVLANTIHNETNHQNHYTKLKSAELNSDINISFKVREILKPSKYHNKYVVKIESIDNQKVSGKSLLNVELDSLNNSLQVDDRVWVKTSFQELNPPLNPYQFDYKSYLNKQNIYHQFIVNSKELLILDQKRKSVYGFAAFIRKTINLNLRQYNFKEDELAIINALLLGQRQDISKEIYDSYTQAGAIHILAVSGLHVGIILLIMNFLLKPLERFKYGLNIKIVLLVIFLWCFAIVAGLSASVTRAVTMFSIVAFAMNLKRSTNVYNTLAISMFILLLFKPNFLFDVGFQLSYLAVFSIVWIQPLLSKQWKPKLWLVDKFWQIFTVTIAAQLGVAPLSLYYFHQFPGLFFVSNLVIIPFLGFILGFGILTIILSSLNILPEILATAFATIISWLNDFVSFISNQEAFLFKQISFNLLMVLGSYLLIIGMVRLFQKPNYKRLISGLVSVVLFISVLIYNKYENSTNEFSVFHKSRFSLIGIKSNYKLMIHHNLDSISLERDKIITNYKVGNHINSVAFDSINAVYNLNNKIMLVVDSLGVYKTSFKPEYVLLRNSPKLNLIRLIDDINPELIIVDGSNYKSYQDRWMETCHKKEIPFHQTSKKGAFIVTY